MNNITVNRI